ncbi:MAG: RecQ family ATP-dependent DNA helicase [Acidimicrobiaceae bacterium]|nr:RecQ family ATP-dependent DNA helicase [Acidimicrobiaceae bacterium]
MQTDPRHGAATGVFNPRDVAEMFAAGGSLMKRARQPRKQQMEMAAYASETLQAGGRILIEAPTGTGKTLAYLVPAIEYARASGDTVVVAPHSKVLQDQIMATLESLSEEVESFSWVLLKGLNNYVDLESLAGELDALAENPNSFIADEVFALAMVCGWVSQTATGDWDDLRAGALEGGRNALNDLRLRVSRTAASGPPVTALDKLDFHHRALQRLRDAHVAVLNHALIVSDHKWNDHSKHLILDEAHNLEDAATDALTATVSRDEIEVLCDTLWAPQKRSGTVRRLSDATGWSLRKDLSGQIVPNTGKPLAEQPHRPQPTTRRAEAEESLNEDSAACGYEPLGSIRIAVDLIREHSEQFRMKLVHYLRIRTGASADDKYPATYRIRQGHDTRHHDYQEVRNLGQHLVDDLYGLADSLNAVNLPEELSGRYQRRRLEAEVLRLGLTAREAARTIRRVLWADDPESMIAVVAISYETNQQDWTWELRHSPVSVAGTLSAVWELLECAVLTSATLRANGSFDYIIGNLGLEAIQTSFLDCPFPWISDNHLLLLTDYLPAPRSRLMEEFTASAAAEIPRLLILTTGRGLALMAARARLEFVRNHARPIVEAEGIPLLSQGDDSAAALVERMRAEKITSLIALRSFWEGVDIPGEALSLLMIEKIPFDSPADPVIGARIETLTLQGKDPYSDYLVPRAALRFAQGVGRLIRTENDRGVTVVLDSRLCRAVPYRDVILKSLPGPPKQHLVTENVDAYNKIAEHLGDIILDEQMLQRLQSVESADAWAELANLELSEAETHCPDVVAARLEEARQMFGFKSWRCGQLETMTHFIKGSDFLSVLPTGSGKSATFQIPALLSPGLTLVVSPLKALMNDQVENLRARKVTKVAAIHSGVQQAEWRDILRGAARGDYKLLYISPERLWSQDFVEALAGVGAARVAVDEAHCISQWGHSFRPEYAAIPDALQRIAPNGNRPAILAVTATATEDVRRDIENHLALKLPGAQVVLSPHRHEIRYFVERCRDKKDRDVRAVQIVEAFRSQPAIVYVPTRRHAVSLAGLLNSSGHIVRPYHGAMDDAERLHTEDAFRHGELDVVVATKAFGMGIDKPDIALIVHLEMPATIEEYVQETGRAARGAVDGKEPTVGTAVLLTTPHDCSIHRVFVESAAPDIKQVRRIWSRLKPGTHIYYPAELDVSNDERTDEASVATALAVQYLQDSKAVVRSLDTPWHGRVSVMSDTRQKLEMLKATDPDLSERGGQLVEHAERLKTDEYRAEEWSEHLGRPAGAVAADLLELNRRDILGFSAWKHAWTLERKPDIEPDWIALEDRAQKRRDRVEGKSRQAKRFAQQSAGCRVQTMLEYFGAEMAETCEQCDQCAELDRPWEASQISREALMESLPVRRIILQIINDTTGSGYSRRNIERALVGQLGSTEHRLPERLANHHLVGRLAFIGAPGVAARIDELVGDGLIHAVASEHEGTHYERLEITADGRDQLMGVG